MKQKRLYLLSGPAGCGKSTWAKTQVEKNGGIWISRDAIRFDIIETRGGDYFDYEDEVFNLFISTIQGAINNPIGTNIYVDATHLNKKARDNVLNRLNLDLLDEVNCVYFDVSAAVAIKRNEGRTGLAHVPPTVIRNMATAHTLPKEDEHFDKIIVIDNEGNEHVSNIVCG